MEPAANIIGIAGVLGVLDITIRTARWLHQFTSNIKNASHNLQRLAQEIHDLAQLLERLADKQFDGYTSSSSSASLHEYVARCQDDLDRLRHRLQSWQDALMTTTSSRCWARVKVALGESNITEMRQTILRHIRMISAHAVLQTRDIVYRLVRRDSMANVAGFNNHRGVDDDDGNDVGVYGQYQEKACNPPPPPYQPSAPPPLLPPQQWNHPIQPAHVSLNLPPMWPFEGAGLPVHRLRSQPRLPTSRFRSIISY